MILTLTLFLTALTLVYFWLYKKLQYWKDKNVYVPPMSPIFGHFTPYVLGKMSFSEVFKDIYEKSEKARVAGIMMGFQPTLLINDVNLLKKMLIKDFDAFMEHTATVSDNVDPLFGKNLFSLEGQKWKDMRSTLSPTFTGSKMRIIYSLMQECCQEFNVYFEKNIPKDNSSPLILEWKETFAKMMCDVIASTAFGFRSNSLKDPENEFYLKGIKADVFTGLKFMFYALQPKLAAFFKVKLFSDEVSNYFRNLVLGNIQQRENLGITRLDMIHLLMEARKGKLKYEFIQEAEDTSFALSQESNIGKRQVFLELSDDDVTAQALLFFLAGFDTVSGALSFLAYEVGVDPEVQKKLQKEIDEVLDKFQGTIKYETLIRLKYLDMVVSETLRKWPQGAALQRKCTRDYILEDIDGNDVLIEKDLMITIPVFGIHRDPQFYENPEKFDPERFSDENKDKINVDAYLPFGLGPRNCIGNRFALMCMKTITFYLLSKFELVVLDRTQIPVKLTTKSVTMISEKGIWLGLKRRQK